MVVDLPWFSDVRSLTSWYAVLLLFFLMHASTSWHWHCIQVSFAIFIFVLIFLLISIFLAPSGSPLIFLRSHLWSQRPRISGITQSFLFRRCLPRSSAAMSVTALLKGVTLESRSAISSTSVVQGANLLPIVAWKALTTVGSFSFSRSNRILGWVGFLWILKVCLESHHHHVP